MSKLETNTIDNISGSSTLTIGSTNTTTVSIPEDVTLGASGKTITILFSKGLEADSQKNC
mgnify:CR=1 FL=1